LPELRSVHQKLGRALRADTEYLYFSANLPEEVSMAHKFTAAFKFEVVRQLQSGEKRLAQVCREHDLDPTLVRGGRERVAKRGAAFPRSSGEEAIPAPTPATLAAAAARIGDRERLVGQLTLENDFLNKAWRRAHSLPPKGWR
jgi:transposase-like protein